MNSISKKLALMICLLVVITHSAACAQPTAKATPTNSPSAAPTASIAPTNTPIPTSIPTPTVAPTSPISMSKVGDIIFFGTYEQDGNLENGKEDLAWRVLDINNGTALLVSAFLLDAQPFDKGSPAQPKTWYNSTLRSWLNSDFYKLAFSTDDQSGIILSTLTTPDNNAYGTDGGATSKDKVFILSVEEAKQFFTNDNDRICNNTKYAIARGSDDNDAKRWWLRTPGYTEGFLIVVRDTGYIYGDEKTEDGSNQDDPGGAIRPAIRINLNSPIFQ